MSDCKCYLRGTLMGLLLTVLMVSLLGLSSLPAQSQEKKETKKSAEQDDVIKVTSNLVNLDVIVKDKKGKAITDLKPEDFTITENGVRQKIEFFDSALVGAEVPDETPVVTSAPVPRQPSSLPRNIIALVLDEQTTEAGNLKQVRDGTLKYVRERINDNDSVALFSIAGNLQLQLPFTQDKTKLMAAIERAYG